MEDRIEEHRRYIYKMSYHLCGDPHEAEDLVQETFLKALENLAGFLREAGLRTWLTSIAVNTYLARRRKKLKHETMILETFSLPDWSGNPERVVIRRELRWCIHHVLQHHLSREYRIVLVLRDLNQLAYREITEILGISMVALKSRLHRARRAFRDHLLKTGCAGLVVDYDELLKILAPCGLECGRCADYEAGEIKQLNIKLLQALGNYDRVAKMKALQKPAFGDYATFREILASFAGASCSGCRGSNVQCPITCAAKDCHKVNEVDFCHQCGEFPCDLIWIFS